MSTPITRPAAPSARAARNASKPAPLPRSSTVSPGCNAALAKILARLPLQWTRDKLTLAGQTYDATQHAPILIYPSPANPSPYIVLNSGVTFREEALLTNAQQTPKLPDWAVIDLRTPPDTKWPGLVIDAGFFDEAWQWPKK